MASNNQVNQPFPLAISAGGTAVTSVTTAPAATAWAGWDANKNLSANSHIEGYATTVTAAGTTTLVVGSAHQQFFTGSTTQTVTLPVTSTLVLGQAFYIVNSSSGNVTVNSSGGNAVQVMTANTTLLVTVILTSGTTAASWATEYVGAASGGTVNSGLINQLAWYAASGTAVSGLATANSGVLVTSAGGVPSISSNLPAGINLPSPFSVNGTSVTSTGTQLNYLSGLTAAPINKITVAAFNASGTYTPTTGMVYCTIECVGGGGAGGGAVTGAAQSQGGGGGGAGGYSRITVTAATIGASKTVTIGAAGTAGSAGNNPGGNGGDTSVTTICVGKGGTGGGAANGAIGIGGAGGVGGTGDIAAPGMNGFSSGAGTGTALVSVSSGAGGSTLFGSGGRGVAAQATGEAGTGNGSGGSGGTTYNNGGSTAGGAGSKGVVVITEFLSA